MRRICGSEKPHIDQRTQKKMVRKAHRTYHWMERCDFVSLSNLGKKNWMRGTCYNMCTRTLIVAYLIMSMYKTTRVCMTHFFFIDGLFRRREWVALCIDAKTFSLPQNYSIQCVDEIKRQRNEQHFAPNLYWKSRPHHGPFRKTVS